MGFAFHAYEGGLILRVRARISASRYGLVDFRCDVPWMRRLGVGGIVTGHRVRFALPGRLLSKEVFRHELEHVYQVLREGRVRFFLKYFYYQLRYGYRKNPFEIEARIAAEAPLNPSEEQLLCKLRES